MTSSVAVFSEATPLPDGDLEPVSTPDPAYPPVAFRNGVEGWVELDYTVEPSMSNHEAYEPLFDLYQRSYQQLKPLLHSLAEMQG